MLIVDLDELKIELGITTSDDDDLLNTLITRVSLSIEKYIGYSLDPVTRKELYNGDDNEYFTLLPTNDEDSVVVTDRISATVYTVDLVDSRHIILEEETESGNKNVKIEYAFGYADTASVPEDLKGVATSWINAKYQENKAGGVTQQVAKSEKIEELAMTYFTPEELIKSGIGGVSDFDILDTYKITSYV